MLVPNCGEAGPKVAGEWVEVEVLDGNADIVRRVRLFHHFHLLSMFREA